MIGRRRRRTCEIQIEQDAPGRINSAQDLVVELEKNNGYIDYTRPLPLEKPAPLPADWLALGISPTDTTLYSHHPLLRDAAQLAQSLLDRAGEPELPAVGTLTHFSFNASVQRLKARPDIAAIIVHYPVYWLLPDISFYVQWMKKTLLKFGREAMHQVVTPSYLDYVEAARNFGSDSSTTLPHTPPSDIDSEHAVLARECFDEAWVASIVALAFVLLHEVGHLRLRHFRDSRTSAKQFATVESFWMAYDPHSGEHEADGYATKILRYLRPSPDAFANIRPDLKIPGQELDRLFVIAMAGLFSSIAILDPTSIWQRLLHPTTHPSALSRSRRVLRSLGLPVAEQRHGNMLVLLASGL